ncbi:MAG TPA: CPBP family intramembrane glutamic endopeptidase [Ktedonobacteraceae bacterium]|nr:CPBP family intramembrane glutamic endopeptidase [Ktedonobacteraceae bacterium]
MASPDSTFVKRYRLPIFELFRRHPVISAIIIFAIDVAIELIVGLFAKSLVPPIPMLPDFIALCVLVVGVIALVTFLGWWKVVGCNPPSEWRNLALLLLPTVLVFLPLLGGFKAVDAGTVVFLLVGYLLTGFHEETLHRGVILRVLQPTGVWPSVLISSLLFGLAHSANLFLHFSGSPVIVGLQMIGAFTFGIGMAALRLRTNTIWPLLLLHAASDMFLAVGKLPVLLASPIEDTVLLIFGIVLIVGMLRKQRAKTEMAEPLNTDEPVA